MIELHMPSRERAVVRVLVVVLLLNLAVAVAKLMTGRAIGSLALTADALHSMLDAASNVVGIVGTVIAARPPDAGHPYGHRRFEAMTALAIGLLIAAGLLALVQALLSASPSEAPASSGLGVLVVGATCLINLAVSRYERMRSRALSSSVLEADAGHTFSDALASLVVLVSFGGAALGLTWADSLAAIVVCAFIARTAWRILSRNAQVLADSARLDPREVARLATEIPGVRGAHRVRSRGSADHVHLDLHLHLDPAWSIAQAHDKAHEVTELLRDAYPALCDIVVHTEPATPDGCCSDDVTDRATYCE